ncbi:MAG: proton-conducting transporter membrane subunit [Methanobacteriaceae archaeon]
MTVQKINPLIIITRFRSSTFLIFLAIFSVGIGSLVGLTQTQTRKLLTYSSVNQVG